MFFKEMYGRCIIRKYWYNLDVKFLEIGEGVSFLEFVEFINNFELDFMDWYWKFYDMLCYLCLIYYDFIGKFENLYIEVD